MCLATIVLWVRSYSRTEFISVSTQRQTVGCGSQYPSLSIYWDTDFPEPPGFHYESQENPFGQSRSFELYVSVQTREKTRFRVLFMPHWLAAILLAIAPT